MTGATDHSRPYRTATEQISRRICSSRFFGVLLCPPERLIGSDFRNLVLPGSIQNARRAKVINGNFPHGLAKASVSGPYTRKHLYKWQSVVMNIPSAETQSHHAASIVLKHQIRLHCIIPLAAGQDPLHAPGFRSEKKLHLKQSQISASVGT